MDEGAVKVEIVALICNVVALGLEPLHEHLTVSQWSVEVDLRRVAPPHLAVTVRYDFFGRHNSKSVVAVTSSLNLEFDGIGGLAERCPCCECLKAPDCLPILSGCVSRHLFKRISK